MRCEKHHREMNPPLVIGTYNSGWQCPRCMIEEAEAMLLVPPGKCEKHGTQMTAPFRHGGIYFGSDCPDCRKERMDESVRRICGGGQ